MRSHWIGLGIALVALVSGIFMFMSPFRHGYDALKLMADLAHIDLPLAKNHARVNHQEVSYSVGQRQHAADLYVPELEVQAGVVLVPGAAEGGRNDPRLVDFANSLSRSGFAVLVPDIPSLRKLQPSADSTREIGDAFVFLRGQEELVQSRWLGITAFSMAVGPAVIASLDPAINEQVKFLLLIGGYYDLVRTLNYLTTGYFELNGRQEHREPNAYGKWVYALSNSQRLEDPSGRELLAALARRKLEDPQASIDDLRAQLDAEGQAVYDLISNSDPARNAVLMERLPAAVQADIAVLNVAAYDLSALHAKVILVHGRDDDIIPFTESVSFAAALPSEQVRLYVLDGLHHVNRDFNAADLWRTWLAMKNLLTRDRD